MSYSTRIYSTVEEDLNVALDRILSGAVREAENKGEEIDPMTANLRGEGGETAAARRMR